MLLWRRIAAEIFGTFWLVFAGCGSAVVAAQSNIGVMGVSIAFGFSVVTMAYAIGSVSGAHLNPAVTLGLWTARRISGKDVLPYVVAQVIGATLAAGLLYVILHCGSPGPIYSMLNWNLGANGYGEGSPLQMPLWVCFLVESTLTFVFLTIILGTTDKRAPLGFAPLAIGLGLTLIHLVGIPFTNLSVNPARSLGPALFAKNPMFLKQVWLFWAAPLLGAGLAGWSYPRLFAENSSAKSFLR